VSAVVLRPGHQIEWASREAAIEAWREKDWRPTCVACGYGFGDMPEGLRHMPLAMIVIEDVRSDVMILLGVCRACLRLTDEELLKSAFKALEPMGITRTTLGPHETRCHSV
jgi:hypothetical protein